MIESTENQSGRLFSGKPCSAVATAFAWTSAPDMPPPVEVGWMSWSDEADGPTMTILSRNVPGRKRFEKTSENE